jgi:hypothetical protein
MINPPNKNIANRAADPNVLATTRSRAIEPIVRKRPSAIWCIEKSKSIKRKNLKHILRIYE